MAKAGKWDVVPRFLAASKRIPDFASYTVAMSPIGKQSKNINSAQKEATSLARKNHGHLHPVVKGKLWRGPARIIVNG